MRIENAIRNYVKSLHDINRDIIKVSSYNALRENDGEDILIHIASELLRLIPFKYNKKEKRINLSLSDGLMEYKKKIEFLKYDFSQLNKSTL